MSKQRPKVKCKLIDEIQSMENSESKRVRSMTNSDDQNGTDLDHQQTVENSNGKKSVHKNNLKIKLNTKVSQQTKDRNNNATVGSKLKKRIIVTPIIQTRGMKKKAAKLNQKVTSEISDELNQLNKIDKLTHDEILGGETMFEEEDSIAHDGVEISINGLDDETDFLEVADAAEPGELISSDEDVNFNSSVASKVVKVAAKKHTSDIQILSRSTGSTTNKF